MSSELVTELDSSFSHSKIDIAYPHIILATKNTDPIPVVIGLLEQGSVPILFTQDDTTYELAEVSGSPLNLHKLLQVYPFTLVKSSSESRLVDSTIKLMEALTWMQQ